MDKAEVKTEPVEVEDDELSSNLSPQTIKQDREIKLESKTDEAEVKIEYVGVEDNQWSPYTVKKELEIESDVDSTHLQRVDMFYNRPVKSEPAAHGCDEGSATKSGDQADCGAPETQPRSSTADEIPRIPEKSALSEEHDDLNPQLILSNDQDALLTPVPHSASTSYQNKDENGDPLRCGVDDDDRAAKRKRGESKVWMFVSKFPSIAIAEEAVNAQKTWSVRTTHATADGRKRFYRCNKVPRKGIQCSAEICLLFEANTDAILLYRRDSEHDHESIKKDYNFGICNETKAEINRLLELHLKPKSILVCLKKSGFKLPTTRQLNNYLAERRRIKYGQSKST